MPCLNVHLQDGTADDRKRWYQHGLQLIAQVQAYVLRICVIYEPMCMMQFAQLG